MRIYYELAEEDVEKALKVYIEGRFGVEALGAQVISSDASVTAQVQAKPIVRNEES